MVEQKIFANGELKGSFMNNKENHIKKLSELHKRTSKMPQTLLDNYEDLIKDNNISPLLGNYGHGKEMLIINLSKNEYINFQKFCSENNYEFVINSIENKYIISCEKYVYLLFKGEIIKISQSPKVSQKESKWNQIL